MVITKEEWEKISKYVPSDILSKIEYSIVARSFKGKAVTVYILTDKGDIEVPGLELNSHWAMCPVLKKGNIHTTKKCLVHIKTGLTCIRFSSKAKTLAFWDKIKDLRINEDDPTKSPDFNKLREFVVNEPTKVNGWDV